jgi:hypothetical protein
MAYIFADDPRLNTEFYNEVGSPYAGPMEGLWDRYLPALGFTGPLKEVVGATDPTQEGGSQPIEGRSRAAQAFINDLKSQGFQIGLKESALGKQTHQYALVGPDGQPVAGSDVRLDAGNFKSLARALAPMAIGALTAGLGAELGASLFGATGTAASSLGGATIAGGVTALTGGSLKDVATNALLASVTPYAKEALGLTSGGLSPEMQATISNNPQGAFLGESAIPSGVTSPTITGYDLGAAAPLAGSAGDMMTGIDMSGNVVNSLTGEVLVPATTAPINALTSAATQPTTQPTVAETATTQPTVAEAATTPPADTTAGLSSADRAALYGDAGYGAGMTGAQTGAFDTTLGLTGSTALAAGAANVAGAAGTAGNLLGDALNFVTSPAGAATIGAVGSVVGGVMAADAATEASRLQSEAARNELELLDRMYRESVLRQKPFLEGGTQAFNRLVGLQTGGPEAAQQFLQMDPGYGFRLGEGMKALERVQAARGGLLSGGAIKAGQRYAQDVASQEYGSAYNRLAGLANLGPQAAGVMSNLGQQYATSAGGAMQDAAAYQGAGTLGRTSAYMGAIQGGLNALSGYANQQQQNQLINRLLGGG